MKLQSCINEETSGWMLRIKIRPCLWRRCQEKVFIHLPRFITPCCSTTFVQSWSVGDASGQSVFTSPTFHFWEVLKGEAGVNSKYSHQEKKREFQWGIKYSLIKITLVGKNRRRHSIFLWRALMLMPLLCTAANCPELPAVKLARRYHQENNQWIFLQLCAFT